MEEPTDDREQLLRALADCENRTKRLERSYQERSKYANESIVLKLLPVWDSLAACLHGSEGTGSSLELLREALGATLEQFREALRDVDVVVVRPAPGEKFDPTMHEAVSTFTGDGESGRVVQVLQDGFSLNDRVIRAARVVVSK